MKNYKFKPRIILSENDIIKNRLCNNILDNILALGHNNNNLGGIMENDESGQNEIQATNNDDNKCINNEPHHWLIKIKQKNEGSSGLCKKCGIIKNFPPYIPNNTFKSHKHNAKQYENFKRETNDEQIS